MSNDKYKNYLYDLGVLVKEKAREAKKENNTDSKINGHDYKIGYLMAFHEILDLMKQQAKVFDINQKEIGLNDIDADLDLL